MSCRCINNGRQLRLALQPSENAKRWQTHVYLALAGKLRFCLGLESQNVSLRCSQTADYCPAWVCSDPPNEAAVLNRVLHPRRIHSFSLVIPKRF